MNMNDFNPAWLAAGGAFALLAGFWNHVKSLISNMSKVMVVTCSLDSAVTVDVARYLRAKYKWVQFSDFGISSVYKTRIDTGMSILVPFKIPTESGLYRGPHGWLWVSGSYSMKMKALRGHFDFVQLVKDATTYDIATRVSEKQDRFYITKVIGSEKGAWALGEALRSRNGSAEASSDSPSRSVATRPSDPASDSPLARVYEDLDTSFLFDKSEYLRSGRNDPFKGLFFHDDALKEVTDAESWMKMGKWYAERSIPWRRGLLIYGPGGTGKSSFTKALGESLGVPIYQFFLNTLSDQEFIREWGSMCTPCIALLEDFDNVFHGRESQTEHKSLSFDCVLNQISGVSSLNGVYLVVTTNDISKIDPALGVSRDGHSGISTRPGRIDRVLFMGTAHEKQRRQIAQHILQDWPEEVPHVVRMTEDMTPAQVQEMCTQLAYERLSGDVPVRKLKVV